MIRYVEVCCDRVRFIGEAETLPEFDPLKVYAVDITGIEPQPQEGWIYNGEGFTAT